MSGPLLLPTWADLAIRPLIVEPMRRYLEQIACVLRPGSVTGADLALRSFAAFLAETAPQVTTIGQVTRGHIESYKPWLAKRPGQNKSRLTTATLALRQDRQPHRRRRVLRGHRPGRRPLRQDRTATRRRHRTQDGAATPRAPPPPRHCHCTRPAELDCAFESICENCSFFQTSIEFRPTLQAQHDDADAKGQDHRAALFDKLLTGLTEGAAS